MIIFSLLLTVAANAMPVSYDEIFTAVSLISVQLFVWKCFCVVLGAFLTLA